MASRIINLNNTSPAAQTGYQLGLWQLGPTSGTDPATGEPVYPVSAEVPNTGGVSKLTASATAAAADCGKLMSFTLSGAATYTLSATPPSVPDGGGTDRWNVKVKNQASSTASLTITAITPAKLDGVTAGSIVLGAGSGISLSTDGTDYFTGSTPGLTSVALAMPAEFSVAGSPITGAGTFTVTKANQSAATAFMGPASGSPAAPTFRAIQSSDLPVGSSSQLGALQVDGTSIAATAGVASVIGTAAVKGVYTGNTAFFSSASTPGSPVTAAFSSNIGVGNAILVFIEWFGGSLTPSAPTDTLGNTYTLVVADGANQICYIALNSLAGANTVSVSFTGSFATLAVRAFEYQNIVGVSAVDASNATHTDTGGGVYVASLTTSNPADVLIGHAIMGGTIGAGSSFTAGYTQQFTHFDSVTNTTEWLVDRNVTSAGSQTLTWTQTSISSHSLILVALKVGTGVQDFNGRTGHVVGKGTDIPVFGASGASHAPGAVPDPGASAGSSRFLCENGGFAVPPGTSGGLTLISDQLLASPAATISFSSIGGFKHLKLMFSARCSGAVTNDVMYMQLNGDTAAHYSAQLVIGTNATLSAAQTTLGAKPSIGTIPGANGAAGAASTGEGFIVDYASSTFLKTAKITTSCLVDTSVSTNFFVANVDSAWFWDSTAAITSILLGVVGGSNFVAGSRFTLYGLS